MVYSQSEENKSIPTPGIGGGGGGPPPGSPGIGGGGGIAPKNPGIGGGGGTAPISPGTGGGGGGGGIPLVDTVGGNESSSLLWLGDEGT